MKYDIVLLREHPELTAHASEWFSSKWNIPKEEYGNNNVIFQQEKDYIQHIFNLIR